MQVQELTNPQLTSKNSLLTQIPILNQKLKMLRQTELPMLDPCNQNLLSIAKGIFESQPEDLQTSLQPSLLSYLEGKSLSPEEVQAQLITQVGGISKFWKKFINKHLQQKQGTDGMKLWETKKKFIDSMKQYVDTEKLSWIRDVKIKRKKLIEIFIKHIEDIEKSQIDLNQQHLKLLKAEIEFYKLIKSNGTKIIKTKKKEKTQIVQQVPLVEINPEIMESSKKVTPSKKQDGVEGFTTQSKSHTSNQKDEKQLKSQNLIQEKPQGKQVFSEKNEKSQKPKKTIKKKAPAAQSPAPEIKAPPVPKITMFNFFKPKTTTQVKQDIKPQQDKLEQQLSDQTKTTQNLMNLSQSQLKTIDQLLKEYLIPKQGRKRTRVCMCIQGNGFYLQNCSLPMKQINPIKPFEQYHEINYENSEIEYNEYREYLVEENIENQQDRSNEDSEQSINRSIVSDSYISLEQGVSESYQQKGLKGQVKFGDKFVYSFKTATTILDKYTIFLVDDLVCPLPTQPPPKEPLTSQNKLQFIRVLHGSYDNTQKLVQKIYEKLQPMSKTMIRASIQQFSSKQSGRRMIKPYFLQQMKQIITVAKIDLQQIVRVKFQQNTQQRQQRKALNRQKRQQNRKQKQLQRQSVLPFISQGMQLEKLQQQQNPVQQNSQKKQQ